MSNAPRTTETLVRLMAISDALIDRITALDPRTDGYFDKVQHLATRAYRINKTGAQIEQELGINFSAEMAKRK